MITQTDGITKKTRKKKTKRIIAMGKNVDTCYSKKIIDGLGFILDHFQEPIFPRKIMTKELGYQVEVFSREEALGYFKSSNYEDCRINAYPPFTEYQGINRT